MSLSNYHGHCRYCDGKGEPELYVKQALEKDFSILGFSSHAPITGESWCMDKANLGAYFEEISALKEKYKGKITLLAALEIDHLQGDNHPLDQPYSSFGLDYSIGSFHMFTQGEKHWAVDGPDEHFLHILNDIYRGSMTAFSEGFYREVGAMLKRGGFQILGHLDLIKKKNRGNRFFREDSPWYRNQIRKILSEISRWGGLVEVNTGGISRGAIDDVYPSPWIIKDAVRMGIPFVLNSDCHSPEHLDFYYSESREILKEAGAREIWQYHKGDWKAEPL